MKGAGVGAGGLVAELVVKLVCCHYSILQLNMEG